MTPLPIVAVVGRPNVGKSTLFNRIVGHRAAIVEDRARTTRDRIYGEAEWNGRRFIAVDTGGLEIKPGDPIEEKVQEQARIAIAEADVIVLVVDSIAGLTPADIEAADLLRTAKAPVLVAANKADNDRRELEAAEFYSLGWEETHPISAAHGRGVADLLDAIVWALPPESSEEIERKRREAEADDWAREMAEGRLARVRDGDAEAIEIDGDEAGENGQPSFGEEDATVSIAIVGRPNVGKSSLFNALLGEDRAIVSDIPGTTRDAIDTHLQWGRSDIVLIDTAGMRRPGKVASGPDAERYSTLRALKAVDRADVAILIVDAFAGLTAQDAHVAGFVVEEGRGLVLALNKWDLLAREDGPLVRRVRDGVAGRGALPRLRADRLDQREDRPARRQGARAGGRRLGRAAQAHPHPGAEPGRPGGVPAAGAAGREARPAQDLLRDPGGGGSADVRLLRPPRRPGAFQLQALPGEPAARRVRLRRDADPAHLPGAGERSRGSGERARAGEGRWAARGGGPASGARRPPGNKPGTASAAAPGARRASAAARLRPRGRRRAGPPNSACGLSPFPRSAMLSADRGVAQPGSAPEWGSGGRAFESLRPDHLLSVKRPPDSTPRAF